MGLIKREKEMTDPKYFKDPMSHDMRNMKNFEKYI